MLDRRRLKNGSKTDFTHVVYSNWFEKIMERTASEKTFKQQFRMKMSTFDKLVELVTLRWPAIHGKASLTSIEKYGGGIRKRVGLFLYVCAHGVAVNSMPTLFAKSSTNTWHVFD